MPLVVLGQRSSGSPFSRPQLQIFPLYGDSPGWRRKISSTFNYDFTNFTSCVCLTATTLGNNILDNISCGKQINLILYHLDGFTGANLTCFFEQPHWDATGFGGDRVQMWQCRVTIHAVKSVGKLIPCLLALHIPINHGRLGARLNGWSLE